MSDAQNPCGVIGVYTDPQGGVIASISDFLESGYGGHTLIESQTIRAKGKLARAVLIEYCSPVVVNALENYDCEQIVGKLKGKMTFIPVGER